MPIYEYECLKCGKTFEVMQKITDKPLKKCIYCGGKVEKLISLSAFQFKGKGWYVTDYSNSRKKTETNNKINDIKTNINDNKVNNKKTNKKDTKNV